MKITNFDYIDIEKEISDRTEEFYRRVNHEWIGLFNDTTYNYHPLYKICPFKDNNDMNYYVKVFEEEESKSSNKRVGIVNMKVSSQQIGSSMWNKPILTAERRNKLFEIINMAIKENCEILVLQE